MTLFPKPKCSCIPGKTHCAHILAVQYANNLDISDAYKVPNIGNLVKSNKNGKNSGRKRRGHKTNSIEKNLPTKISDNICEVNENVTPNETDEILDRTNHFPVEPFHPLPFLEELVKINLSIYSNLDDLVIGPNDFIEKSILGLSLFFKLINSNLILENLFGCVSLIIIMTS